MLSADVNAEASVQSTVIRVRTGDATITGNASAESEAIRVRTSVAEITGTATVTGLGGVEYAGSGTVVAYAYVDAQAQAVYSANGSITNTDVFPTWLKLVIAVFSIYCPFTKKVKLSIF